MFRFACRASRHSVEVMWPRSRNALCLFLFLFPWCTTSAIAQDSSSAQRTLSLNVFNAAGNLVRGLEPADSAGRLGGKPVKILSVKPDERPHRIAVLLDTSCAVLGQPDAEEWVAANTIAFHFSQAPPQNASLALFSFFRQGQRED